MRRSCTLLMYFSITTMASAHSMCLPGLTRDLTKALHHLLQNCIRRAVGPYRVHLEARVVLVELLGCSDPQAVYGADEEDLLLGR